MKHNQIIYLVMAFFSVIIFLFLPRMAASMAVITMLFILWPMISISAANRLENVSSKHRTITFTVFFSVYYLAFVILILFYEYHMFYFAFGTIVFMYLYAFLHKEQDGKSHINYYSIFISLLVLLAMIYDFISYAVQNLPSV